jgi:tRNA(Ile2) C34 agmatinyltransferase TiaS
MNWFENFIYFGAGPSIAIPMLVIVLLAIVIWQDKRRPPKGACQKCGYDLTGNASGRCPECGTTIEETK